MQMIRNKWNEMVERTSLGHMVMLVAVCVPISALGIWMYVTLAMLYIEKFF